MYVLFDIRTYSEYVNNDHNKEKDRKRRERERGERKRGRGEKRKGRHEREEKGEREVITFTAIIVPVSLCFILLTVP